MLDGARLDIAQGRLRGARVLLARHAEQFRDGRLGEEREALIIRLLVREGYGRSSAPCAARPNRPCLADCHGGGCTIACGEIKPAIAYDAGVYGCSGTCPPDRNLPRTAPISEQVDRKGVHWVGEDSLRTRPLLDEAHA